MVQKKLEELQSMKQHLLYQQEEERQAQFMMRQETLAQQQLQLEQIQQLQQQLHQQLEEQKIRQVYQYNYDPSGCPHVPFSDSHLHVLTSVIPSLSHPVPNPPSPSSTSQAPQRFLTSCNPYPFQLRVFISTWNVPHSSFPFLCGHTIGHTL